LAICATSSRHARRRAGARTSSTAAIVGGIANFHKLPHTLTEVNNALYNGVVRAALDCDVERFTYVSSSMVFERATLDARGRAWDRAHGPRRHQEVPGAGGGLGPADLRRRASPRPTSPASTSATSLAWAL